VQTTVQHPTWEYILVRAEYVERMRGEQFQRVTVVHGPDDVGQELHDVPLSQALAALGAEGWELAGIDPVIKEGLHTPGAWYVLKRQSQPT